MIEPSWPDHALAALFGLGLPLLAALQSRSRREPVELDSAARIATYWANSAALGLGAGLVALAWWRAGRSAADLGLGGEAAPGFWVGVLVAAGLLAVYAADTWAKVATPERLARTRERWRIRTPFMPSTPRELAHASVLALSAGFCEEVIFRGFLIAYVASHTGSTGLGLAAAVALPAVAFGVAHLYQGWRDAAKIVAMAAAFGAVYVLTGTLWISIAIHVAIDACSSVLGVWLILPRGTTGETMAGGDGGPTEHAGGSGG